MRLERAHLSAVIYLVDGPLKGYTYRTFAVTNSVTFGRSDAMHGYRRIPSPQNTHPIPFRWVWTRAITSA